MAAHVASRSASATETGEDLLQAVDRVHQPLKLRPVDQIERALFAGKHFERRAPRRRDHSGGFLGGQIAVGNRFHRQPNQYAQTPNAAAFFVDLFLGGGTFVGTALFP